MPAAWVPRALLTDAQVGELTGYRPELIRQLARQGKFPAPIDATLHPKLWRWSPVVLDRYIAGEWSPAGS
ncbi:MAG TPA: hypothetical protein VNQ73_14775 [Ilumatobacter sp.]|nr:hypothetical protein [Ilumatobacter sp.]